MIAMKTTLVLRNLPPPLTHAPPLQNSLFRLLTEIRAQDIYTTTGRAGGRGAGGRFSYDSCGWDGPSGHRTAARWPEGPSQPRKTIGKSTYSGPHPAPGDRWWCIYPGPPGPKAATQAIAMQARAHHADRSPSPTATQAIAMQARAHQADRSNTCKTNVVREIFAVDFPMFLAVGTAPPPRSATRNVHHEKRIA